VSIVGEVRKRITFKINSFKTGELLQGGRDVCKTGEQIVGSREGTKVYELLYII
jgi:hypothetical protein